MKLEESLDQFFSLSHKAYTVKELEKKFKVTEKEKHIFYQALYKLEKAGKIYYSEDGYYLHVPYEFYLDFGVLEYSKRGNYYISTPKKNILIKKEEIKNAKAGDSVFVEEIESSNGHRKYHEGKIVRVVRPPKKEKEDCYFYQGVLKKNYKEDYYYIEKDNKRILLPKDALNGAYPEDIVSVQIKANSTTKKARVVNIMERSKKEHLFTFKNGSWHPVGTEDFKILLDHKSTYQEGDEIIGEVSRNKVGDCYQVKVKEEVKNDGTYRDYISSLAFEMGLRSSFPTSVMNEVDRISSKISEEEIKRREDFRSLETFTIDPVGAKDLDDALSLIKYRDRTRLFVHVADIDYYVKYGSALFEEAIRRGSSGYFGNMVIPQYPEKLSQDLCSLNPDSFKLTKTFIMDINEKGEVFDFSVVRSVIKSDCQMDYESVDDVLLKNKYIKSYLPFVDTLKNMTVLSSLLDQKRKERGSIPFEQQELEYEFNEEGVVVGFHEREDGISHKIVENAMLLANQSLADYAYYLDIPFVYRNHEASSEKDFVTLRRLLRSCSNHVGGFHNFSNPQNLQRYFTMICRNRTKEEKKYLSKFFLQTMNEAYYQEENKGHFGLAMPRYATLTSPIRKASDTINHISIGQVLDYGVDTEVLRELEKRLKDICIHITNQQKEIEDLEVVSDTMLLNKFIAPYLNQDVKAKIDFFMENQMFLQTEEHFKGSVLLGKDFIYDKNHNTMVDRSKNECYHIGDEVTATIKSFDQKEQSVVFTLAKNEKVLKKKRGKKDEKYKRR